MELKIVEHSSDLEQVWDDFVKFAVNGTIYHSRKFLGYHPHDRFIDRSILIYKKDVLVCVVPACYDEESDTYFSHRGATYGGPVFAESVFRIRYLSNIVDKVFEYYEDKIEFRLAPSFYFEKSTEVINYLLGSRLRMRPEVCWYIPVETDMMSLIKNRSNKQYLRKLSKDSSFRYEIASDVESYATFHDILSRNLKTFHDSKPTHSLEEFLKLRELLGESQKLFLAHYNDRIISGVFIVKATSKSFYTVYIAKEPDVRYSGVGVIYLVSKILDEIKSETTYLDLGISTECGGEILNQGLSEFKEDSLCGISGNRYLFTKL